MQRLNIRTVLLELTRECNLSCKHCFRGESENVYMNPDLIDKVFKNTARINTLLLTGGEPFLAINQLKRLRDIIMNDRTNVGEVIVVTNGTILTDEIIDILNHGGKIWLYYDKDNLVCSCFYIPSSNKSLNKHNVYYDEKITGSLGPIMVSPDYVGNGFQSKMQEVFNKYNISLGNKYIFTKTHSNNIYSIRNIEKDGYIKTDEYENERGMNTCFVKDLFNDIINDLEYTEFDND